MSYILEAIRRSEEARHKRVVPAVSTIHAARPAAARAPSRALQVGLAMGLAAALVVAGGLAVGPSLLQMNGAGPSVPASPAVQSAGPVAGPVAEGENRTASAPEAPPDPAPEPGARAQEVPAQAAAAPAPASGQETAAPAAVAPVEAEAEAKPKRRPYSSPASGETKPKREPKALAAPPPLGPAAAPGGARPDGAPAPAAELVAAPALRDLPVALQRTLPGIAITLHRYAPTPGARMIRVNGRVAHEGDVVAGDLGVAEITRNGVVFAIGEQRFYMDAFQTWQAKGGS
jgi:general secretion pathway protein B